MFRGRTSRGRIELRHKTIATIGVRDLKASHDVVTVTRRGGFLSAAARRLLEIVRREYRRTKGLEL
jgi:hypothetical protein